MVYLFKNVSRGGFLASKVSHPLKNMLKANSERDYKILRKRHGCCKLLLENYTFDTYEDNKNNQADSDKITYRISGSLLPSHTFETCQDGTNDLIENDKDNNKSSNCCGLLIQNYTFETYSSSNSDKDNKMKATAKTIKVMTCITIIIVMIKLNGTTCGIGDLVQFCQNARKFF